MYLHPSCNISGRLGFTLPPNSVSGELGLRLRNRGLTLIGPFQTRPATVSWRLVFSTVTFIFFNKIEESIFYKNVSQFKLFSQ